ncbi:MAG: hypothetical protein J5642_04110 [Bacteroidales bacterium]|nr:hypothetical protein [Bacteroidales bacterium]
MGLGIRFLPGMKLPALMFIVLFFMMDSKGEDSVFDSRGRGLEEGIKFPAGWDFYIDGVKLGFGMTMAELRNENANASIKRFRREDNWDEDAAIYYYEGYDYYLINNTTAAFFNDNARLSGFCTRNRNFQTERHVRVGDTWGDMENAYPELEFFTDFLYYNHFTHTISSATLAIAQKGNCNIAFVFYLDQFTDAQWDGIASISPPSDFDTNYDAEDLPYHIHQSIRTSVKIAEIEVWENSSEDEYDEFDYGSDFVYVPDISGEWQGESNYIVDIELGSFPSWDFSLNLECSGSHIKGGYFVIYAVGMKMDGDLEIENMKGEWDGEKYVVKYETGWGGYGEAVIIPMSDRKIIWRILWQEGSGLAPESAVLNRKY